MLYALSEQGERIKAFPRRGGYCPMCGEPLTPKCGAIVSWHWAHRQRFDCDPWWEPESAWHLGWKARAPAGRCEVTISGHRADIVGRAGVVIELQHGTLTPEEFAERERHYRRLVWLIDASPFIDNLTLRQKNGFYTWRWRWPRRSLWAIRRPQFWDLGDGRILEVKRLYGLPNAAGWGVALTADEWAARYIDAGVHRNGGLT